MRSSSHIRRIHLSLLMGMRLGVPRGRKIGKNRIGGAGRRAPSGKRQGRKIGPAWKLVQTRNEREIVAKNRAGASLEIHRHPGYIRGPEIVKDFTNSAPGA